MVWVYWYGYNIVVVWLGGGRIYYFDFEGCWLGFWVGFYCCDCKGWKVVLDEGIDVVEVVWGIVFLVVG